MQQKILQPGIFNVNGFLDRKVFIFKYFHKQDMEKLPVSFTKRTRITKYYSR